MPVKRVSVNPKPSIKREAAFNPASLSNEEQEAVIEHYLGAHPKYFVYWGNVLEVDIHNSHREGKKFNGFLPDLRQRMLI